MSSHNAENVIGGNKNSQTSAGKSWQDVNVWKRGIAMLLFGFLAGFVRLAITLIAVFQFFSLLLTSEPNSPLVKFGQSLNSYLYQINQFLTINSEIYPFPFADWPSGTVDVARATVDGKAHENSKGSFRQSFNDETVKPSKSIDDEISDLEASIAKDKNEQAKAKQAPEEPEQSDTKVTESKLSDCKASDSQVADSSVSASDEIKTSDDKTSTDDLSKEGKNTP